MTAQGWWVVGILVLVALVLLEGKRQERCTARAGGAG